MSHGVKLIKYPIQNDASFVADIDFRNKQKKLFVTFSKTLVDSDFPIGILFLML